MWLGLSMHRRADSPARTAMRQGEVETEEKKDSWSTVLLEILSESPEPNSPLFVRATYAAFLVLVMPVLWPMLMGMILVVFCATVFAVGAGLLISPIMVLFFGIERKNIERLEVEVDKDGVSAVTAAVRSAGGKVSRR